MASSLLFLVCYFGCSFVFFACYRIACHSSCRGARQQRCKVFLCWRQVSFHFMFPILYCLSHLPPEEARHIVFILVRVILVYCFLFCFIICLSAYVCLLIVFIGFYSLGLRFIRSVSIYCWQGRVTALQRRVLLSLCPSLVTTEPLVSSIKDV